MARLWVSFRPLRGKMAHTSLEMAIKLGRFGTLFQQQLQFCAASTIRHAYAALTLPQRLASPSRYVAKRLGLGTLAMGAICV